jgi:hypothetical protein
MENKVKKYKERCVKTDLYFKLSIHTRGWSEKKMHFVVINLGPHILIRFILVFGQSISLHINFTYIKNWQGERQVDTEYLTAMVIPLHLNKEKMRLMDNKCF